MAARWASLEDVLEYWDMALFDGGEWDMVGRFRGGVRRDGAWLLGSWRGWLGGIL